MGGLGEERMRTKRAGGKGGTFLAVKTQMKERITGSRILCERDREREIKSKIMHARGESQSEREASKPLKKTLRLTPSCPPLHTQYTPSLSQSR